MPLASAHRLVPEATFVEPDLDADRRAAETVFEALARLTPSLAGSGDPTVLFLNTELMQNFWSDESTVTVVDIDSGTGSDDPFEAQKTQFAIARELVQASGGDTEVLEKYHAGLVAPFCLSAVKSFFDESNLLNR